MSSLAKSSLDQFLRQCSITFDEDNKPITTHTSLRGGKWNIPCDHMGEFHQLYVDVMHDQKYNESGLFIVERKSPIFKMICDLDFEGTEESIRKLLQSGAIRRAVQCIQALIAEYFAEDHGPLYVVVCEASGLKRRANNKVKLGVHLIWPHLFIDRAASLMLRCMIIYRLEEKGHFQGFDLSSVVDRSVLEGNGLRMIGSYKVSNCKGEKGSQKCPLGCKRPTSHIFDDDRIYMPTYVMDVHGDDVFLVMKQYYSDRLAMVKALSIRTHLQRPPTPNTDIASDELRAWYQSEKQSRREKTEHKREAEKKSRKEKRTSFMPDFGALDRIDEQEKELDSLMKAAMPAPTYEELLAEYKAPDDHSAVCHDGTIKSAIQSFLAANFWEPYGQSAKVTYVSHNPESNCWTAGTDCKWCTNVDREHGSNNVYYVFTPSGVYQKCRNDKWDEEAQRERKKSGKRCCEYRGPKILMGPELMKMLNLDIGMALVQITGKKRPLTNMCFNDAVEIVNPLTDDEITQLF